jgi:Galactosyltransferase
MRSLNRAKQFYNDRISTRRMRRRFSAMLHESLGEAVEWSSLSDVRDIARTHATLISNLQTGPLAKGAPDHYAIRRLQGEQILKHIESNEPANEMGSILNLAQKVTSIAPENVTGFRLYLSIFWIVNYDTIQCLRSVRSPYIALHMTCWPRIARAQQSIESFSAIPSSVMRHLKLLGGSEKYTFDAATGILGVPSSDAYEGLPAKIFSALLIITLACNPECVLKLDDDNRLADGKALIKLLDTAKDCKQAAQYGNLIRPSSPSAHHRGWHIGKCSAEALSNSLFEMPIPHAWALGDRGYILNRQALWRLAWSSVFYRRWLDNLLGAEDVAVGEIADKTWIEKIDSRPIGLAISRVDDY